MTNFGNLITAAITPFDKNGIISTDTFFRLCRKLVHDKSESIVLTGTTGESPNLTQDDREIIYKTAKDSVGDKVKLIAGTGTYSTKESIENSRIAEDLGMDGIMIVTPYYSKPSQLGILKHFEAINNKSNLPIMAYNIPGRTSTLIELETIETLVNDINIHSIKDAVGDIKFSIEHIGYLEEPDKNAKASIRWFLEGKHVNESKEYGKETNSNLFIMGINHVEFGNYGINREWVLFDEVAIWKQIIMKGN